jgi:UDP-hydrolysing UDP-N-acetyl-D-glucosamine 2-epimerase
MKKILLILESRASYGYSKNIYKLLKNDKNFNVKSLVTGTHLSKELGSSFNNIKKDKIKIDYKINFFNKNLSVGIGKLILGLNKILKKFEPEIVMIFGDRVELMSVAISCCYRTNIVLAHVQAGDRSGHIDDMTRMALAKLAHLHFPATKKAYNRLIKLGEDEKRIHLVGAPQLDDIDFKSIKNKKIIKLGKININLNEKFLLILQHPVFKDQNNYHKIFDQTLKACAKFDYKKYIIYPNYDPGYHLIIKKIKKLKNKNFLTFKNLDRENFLTLAAHSQCLIGNSSAGLLESPSLKIGVVNIGDRQNFRERNLNVFNAKHNYRDIALKIQKAVNIKNKLNNLKNIHGDGKSSKRIYKILKQIKITQELLIKDTTY